MGIITQEDIAGYWIDDGQILVCTGCVKEDEIPDKGVAKKIVTHDEIESSDDLYICDRCDKQIE